MPAKGAITDGRCCVFQPFDNGPFDKRYEDILDPAIRAANLDPYRVDRDPGATILIDTLHDEIKTSAACLADISSDNPNVWYELGYALAINKPTVMICSQARITKLPFDIQHRKTIRYSIDSPRDFEKLKEDVTAALEAQMRQRADINEVVSASSSMRETEGLRPHEISTLAMIMALRGDPSGGPSFYVLKQALSGIYNELGVNLAVVALLRQELIESYEDFEEDYNHNKFTAYRLTSGGEQWLLDNQERLEIKTQSS
jgi:nucleoside 2-deoxyribosyltransferase